MAVIKTKEHGKMSRTKLKKAVRQHGTMANYARSINVAPSTVRNWKLRLAKVNANG